jgi:hypothetical protein
VNREGPVQTTYRWTGAGINKTSGGVVVWRISGDVSRWDSVADASSPEEGRFIVVKTTPSDALTFGCAWRIDKTTPSNLITDCGPSDGGTTLLDGELGQAFPLLAGTALVRDGTRTVLRQSASCYKEQSRAGEEICVDVTGHVLYFSYHQTSGSGDPIVLEATAMTNTPETFDWPSIALVTPSGQSPVSRSRTELQIPSAVHLP